MKLRSKLILAFSLSWLLITVSSYFFTNLIIKRDYRAIENQRITLDVQRLLNGVQLFTSTIDFLNRDWAGWDDTYKFINDLNADYVKSNLIEGTFTDTKLNLIAYFDTEGRFRFGRFYDFQKKNFIQIPKYLAANFSPNNILLQNNSINSSHLGFLSIPNGYFALSSRPILTSAKMGPVRGTIIMGRIFTADDLKAIANETGLQVNLFRMDEIADNPILGSVVKKLNKGKILVDPIDDKLVAGFTLLNDIYDMPIGLFQITSQRAVWQQWLRTSDVFLFSLLASGVFIFLLLLFTVKELVLDRLLRASKEVVEIGKTSKFTDRLNISGKDELTDLSQSVNSLLNIIENSKEELEERVRQRTTELQKINTELSEEISTREKIEMRLHAGEKQLDHIAHHDVLTGLPNRSLFNELLTRAIDDAKRKKKRLAVLFLDLDGFKKINDVLGHHAGDEYLQLLAKNLEEHTRGTDVVSRLGGDEFIFFISDFKNTSDIEKVAQKILDIVSWPQQIHGQQIQLSGSMGISIFPSDGSSLEELISSADVAMYKAKESGKNQYHFFKEIFNIQAKEELRLENDLRIALNNTEEITVFYQPIISIIDQKIVGVEALARWRHPEFGFLLPDKFISLAEKSGLINSLGEAILIEALRTFKNWKAKGLPIQFITVNFSTIQFKSKQFLSNISKALQTANFDGDGLIVEITESVLMEAEEVAISILRDLQRKKIKTAIDDFGTGYSSLSYLQKFPIQYLKIDQAFIKSVTYEEDSAAITNSVIVLGHSLKLQIIAEGVETKEQLDYLVMHGCDLAQGYLIGRPVDKDDMEELLVEEKNKQT